MSMETFKQAYPDLEDAAWKAAKHAKRLIDRIDPSDQSELAVLAKAASDLMVGAAALVNSLHSPHRIRELETEVKEWRDEYNSLLGWPAATSFEGDLPEDPQAGVQ